MASKEQILVESLAIAVASHYSGHADDNDRMFADIREIVGPLLAENERLKKRIEDLCMVHADNAALRQQVAELEAARGIMFELLRYADDEGISNSRWLRGTLQSAREFLKRTEPSHVE